MKHHLNWLWALAMGFLITVPLFAQNNNGAWQTLHNGVLSLRVPPDWIPIPDITGTRTVNAPLPGTTLIFDVTLLPPGKTLEMVIAESQNHSAGTMVAVLPVRLPAGDSFRIEGQHHIEGHRLHYIGYVLALENTIINIAGFVPEDAGDEVARYIRLFDRIASTLTIDDPRAQSWPRYADSAGLLSLQIPPDWQKTTTGEKVLTVIQPQINAIVTLNYRTLAGPMTLEEITRYMLSLYQEQGLTVTAFDPVSLPVGQAYRATLTNLPAQAADGTWITTQQFQYAVLRGDTLILINAGCEFGIFETCRPLLEQIVDTVVPGA